MLFFYKWPSCFSKWNRIMVSTWRGLIQIPRFKFLVLYSASYLKWARYLTFHWQVTSVGGADPLVSPLLLMQQAAESWCLEHYLLDHTSQGQSFIKASLYNYLVICSCCCAERLAVRRMEAELMQLSWVLIYQKIDTSWLTLPFF